MNNLAAALIKAQSEFPAIPKDGAGNFGKHATLHTIAEKTVPILTKNGLAILQFPTQLDGQPALRTKLLHESGAFEEDTMLLILDKQNSQAQGSALTYGRRYAWLAILGLVADEDDDGQAASRPRQARQAAQPVQGSPQKKAPSLSEIDDLTKAYAEILDKPRGTVLEKLTAKFPEWRNDEAQTKLAVEHMKKLLEKGVAAA